jgi:uncharacterized protein (UPF0332 family)
MPPKQKHELAREHLGDARSAIDEDRWKEAVNALFYGAEAAVVYVADHYRIDTKKQHWMKADVATQLFREGRLEADYGPLLRNLNAARKEIWYEGEEPALVEELETLAGSVEELVKTAEKLS